MEIERRKLIEILSIVRPGIATKAIVDQATHFIFTGEQILTYDDRICICSPFETDFKGSVPGEEFYKIIGEMKEEKVSFSVKEDKLRFDCGDLSAALVLSQEGDVMSFIETLKIPSLGSKKWKSLPRDFLDAVYFCMFSAAKTMTGRMPFLNCLYFKDTSVVSSDNVRITRYFMESGLEEFFLLPLSSVVELVKIGSLESYIKGESWIYFKTSEGVVFSSRIITGDYPDVHSLFDFEAVEIVFPDDLKEAVEAVSILAPGETDLDKLIDVLIGDGKVKCRGEKQVGWVESVQNIKDYGGEKISFSINPSHLIQILDKTKLMKYGKGKAVFTSDLFDHLVSLVVE